MTDSMFLIESLGSLYSDVQSAETFHDSKYFVDCIPNKDISLILKEYERQKNTIGFDLKAFVGQHFILPPEQASVYQSANKPIIKHLQDLWNELLRKPGNTGGTLIPLPHPYIVPGGRFREIYYWDSYFTMLGLRVSKRIDIIEDMISNFAYLIDTIGFIPNGNRSYYLGRSQPPFFALMVSLLAEEKGDDVFNRFLPQLEKEYAFWMDGESSISKPGDVYRRVVRMQDQSVLNRYWDDQDSPRPEAYAEDIELAKKSGNDTAAVYRHVRAAAESGWDFSSRWFADENKMETICTTDLIPVDLNCLLVFLEQSLSRAYTFQNKPVLAEQLGERAEKRKNAINQYCWSRENGFYFDYHFTAQQTTNSYTLAALFPLYFFIASPDQAKHVATVTESSFLQTGGVRTTLTQTGQQWDAPNGWAPLQWITYKGLKNYLFPRLAAEVRKRWMTTNEKTYEATGKMMEKYNVTDNNAHAGGGEYPNQDGFGWTNGVYLALHSEGA